MMRHLCNRQRGAIETAAGHQVDDDNVSFTSLLKTRLVILVCLPVHGSSSLLNSVTSADSHQDYPNEYLQETGIMDIEGANERINGPLSPPASPEMGKEDTLRMSVDGDEKKYTGGVVPHAGDEGVTKPDADDCISLEVAHYR
jgi:hypothetical protein